MRRFSETIHVVLVVVVVLLLIVSSHSHVAEACSLPSPVQSRTTTLLFDCIGKPRSGLKESSMSELATEFTDVYNSMSNENCDALYRRVLQTDISVFQQPTEISDVNTEGEGETEEEADEEEGDMLQSYRLIAQVSFNCYGNDCDGETVLLEQNGSFFDDEQHEDDGDHGRHGNRRRLRRNDSASGRRNDDSSSTDSLESIFEDEADEDDPGNSVDGNDSENSAVNECSECTSSQATHTAPTANDVRSELQRKVSKIRGFDYLQNILEVESVDCSDCIDFESSVTIHIEQEEDEDDEDDEDDKDDEEEGADVATVSADELQSLIGVLAASFTNSFNYYQVVTCNPNGQIQVESVELVSIQDDSSNVRRRDRRRLQLSFSYYFLIRGKCYGCAGERMDLFNEVRGRRQRRNIRRRLSNNRGVATISSSPIRLLQDTTSTTNANSDHACFCAVDPSGVDMDEQVTFEESYLFEMQKENKEGFLRDNVACIKSGSFYRSGDSRTNDKSHESTDPFERV